MILSDSSTDADYVPDLRQLCGVYGCKEDIFLACLHCPSLLCFDHMDTDCVDHSRLPEQPLSATLSSTDSSSSAVIDMSQSDTTGNNAENICDLLSSKSKSRKRQRNMQKWKRNQVKQARLTGQSYVNHRGNRVAAKVPAGAEPICKCKFKCSERVDAECRSAIFTSYYDRTLEAQNAYLFGCMEVTKPKRLLSDSERNREISVEYKVKTVDGSTKVCKSAFMKLHSISQSKVDYIIQQAKMGVPSIGPSMRGKHKNRPKSYQKTGENWSVNTYASFQQKAHITAELIIQTENT